MSIPVFVGIICCVFFFMKKLKGNTDDYMSLVMRKPAFCICENKDAHIFFSDHNEIHLFSEHSPVDLKHWNLVENLQYVEEMV